MPGSHLEVRDHLEPAERAEVDDLLVAAGVADGRPPLNDAAHLELEHPVAGRFVAVTARTGDRRLAGYAQLTGRPGSWSLAVVVAPAARPASDALAGELLAAALAEAARRGGGHLTLWDPGGTASLGQAAERAGLTLGRQVCQMRVPLPLPEAQRSAVPPLAVRPFCPGADEAAWLEVNNRAFAGHPEQGRWDLAALAAREAEPWFDPAGFLLYEADGRLLGSCWTKVHAAAVPPMGEIYVISVDPAAHGRGLGRALTVAGLDWLAGAGLGLGMLHVDADNAAAVHLYGSLGFTVHHVDRAYVVDL